MCWVGSWAYTDVLGRVLGIHECAGLGPRHICMCMVLSWAYINVEGRALGIHECAG